MSVFVDYTSPKSKHGEEEMEKMPYVNVVGVNIMVALGGMNLYCDL